MDALVNLFKLKTSSSELAASVCTSCAENVLDEDDVLMSGYMNNTKSMDNRDMN